MPLTSKLKADYVELINQKLDHIQINSMEEFELIKKGLQNIFSPQVDYHPVKDLEERISEVAYYLNSPEQYVESPQNYSEYQQIIKNRINAKIIELESFSEEQKKVYLLEQQNRKTLAADYQQKIAGYDAPQPKNPASDRPSVVNSFLLLFNDDGHIRVPYHREMLNHRQIRMQEVQEVLDEINTEWLAQQLAELPGNPASDRLSVMNSDTPVTSLLDGYRAIQGFSGTVSGDESQDLTPVDGRYGFFSPRQQGFTTRREEFVRAQAGAQEVRLRLLNNQLANNPDDTEARLERAQILGRYENQALEDYNYILERFPDNVTALLGRASFYESLVQETGISGENAWNDYHRVLAIDPENRAAHEGIHRLPSSSLGLD